MPAKQGTEREEKGNLKETFQDETLTVAEIELACAMRRGFFPADF